MKIIFLGGFFFIFFFKNFLIFFFNFFFQKRRIIYTPLYEPFYFKCHFFNDPVMPGCLGVDALWQLTGFNLGWRGMEGRGRALGVGEVKFTGMVTPQIKLVTYEVNFTRIINRRLKLGLADGRVFADGEQIYSTRDMKVGLFNQQT